MTKVVKRAFSTSTNILRKSPTAKVIIKFLNFFLSSHFKYLLVIAFHCVLMKQVNWNLFYEFAFNIFSLSLLLIHKTSLLLSTTSSINNLLLFFDTTHKKLLLKINFILCFVAWLFFLSAPRSSFIQLFFGNSFSWFCYILKRWMKFLN